MKRVFFLAALFPGWLVLTGCGGGGGGGSTGTPAPAPEGIETRVDLSLAAAPGSREASRLFRTFMGLRPSLPASGASAAGFTITANGQQLTGAGAIRLPDSQTTLTIAYQGRTYALLVNLPQTTGQRIRLMLRQEGALDLNGNGAAGDTIPAAFVVVDANLDDIADTLFLHETLESGARLTRSAQGVVWVDLNADGQHAPSQGDVLMADLDNDGQPDSSDLDDDADGLEDVLDDDDDNDGIPDAQDTSDTDNDNDGRLNFADPDFHDSLIPATPADSMAQIRGLVSLSFLFRNQIPADLAAFTNGYQLTAALDDRFSDYFSATEKAAQTVTGFSGIGVGLEANPNGAGVRVRYVSPGSPAAQGGVRVNDVLVAAGPMDLTQATVNEAAYLIRGDTGTRLLLTVSRTEGIARLTLTRAQIPSSPYSVELAAPTVRRLIISSFISGVGAQAAATLNNSQGMTGIILDLRGNPGGLVSEAALVADLFLNQGVIYSFREADGSISSTRNAAAAATDNTLPLVVLVDRNSASASEILAAALKENSRASIVGETTFGKGVAQRTYDLSPGDAVKLTTSYWLTPTGGNVHGTGVTPTHAAAADQALNTALGLLAAP